MLKFLEYVFFASQSAAALIFNKSESPSEEPSIINQTYDAIIISDLHLGTRVCQTEKILAFLRRLTETLPKQLILNGDVLESLEQSLYSDHWDVLFQLREIGTKIPLVWVCGNHDTAGAKFVAALIGARFLDSYIFQSGGKTILCIHGDEWDKFILSYPFLTWCGDWIYSTLQRFTPSLALWTKRQSKIWVRCENKVREGALAMAKDKYCDLICCGHTHSPDFMEGYINSGSWVEPDCSYIAIINGKATLKKG